MAEFIKATDNIKLYLTFHSYGQLLLFPYVSNHFQVEISTKQRDFVISKLIALWQGYTNERIPEYNDLVSTDELFSNQFFNQDFCHFSYKLEEKRYRRSNVDMEVYTLAEILTMIVRFSIFAFIQAKTNSFYWFLQNLCVDPSSGETIDYVYGVKKVPLVYTIELRDTGETSIAWKKNSIIILIDNTTILHDWLL